LNSLDFDRLEQQIKPTKLTCVPFLTAIQESLKSYVDMAQNGTKPGLFIGYEQFDSDTGGLLRASLNVITAETGGCKSTFATNILNHVAVKRRKPTAVFSYEMLQGEFVDMLFSINANVNRNKFNTGQFHDHDLIRMTHAVGEMGQAPLYIFDVPSTVEELEEACLQLHAGVPLELVIVDYLQLVTPTSNKDMREQQVAHVSRSLKRLAGKLKCPVIALSQLNEDGKVRESRAIAQDANLILNLTRDEDVLTLKIAKGRRVAKKEYRLEFLPLTCTIK